MVDVYCDVNLSSGLCHILTKKCLKIEAAPVVMFCLRYFSFFKINFTFEQKKTQDLLDRLTPNFHHVYDIHLILDYRFGPLF